MPSALNFSNQSTGVSGYSGFSGAAVSGFSGYPGINQIQTPTVVTAGTTVNDLAINNNNVIICATTATDTIITGIVSPVTIAKKVTVMNTGTGRLTLNYESVSSVAGNRITYGKNIGTPGPIFIGPGGVVDLIYDLVTSRWIVSKIPEITVNGYIAGSDGGRFDMAFVKRGTITDFYEDPYIVFTFNVTNLQARRPVGAASTTCGVFGMAASGAASVNAFPIITDSNFIPVTATGTLTTSAVNVLSPGISADYDDIITFYMVLSSESVRYRVTALGGTSIGFIVERWNFQQLTVNKKVTIF